MAQCALAVRLKNAITKRSVTFGAGETGPCSNHKYDVIEVLPFNHDFSDRERTIYGILLVTDIPAGVAQKAKERIIEDTRLGEILDRPRWCHIPVAWLKVEYPGLATKLDKWADPTFFVSAEQTPEVTWAKLKKCIWNKLASRLVTDAEVEE